MENNWFAHNNTFFACKITTLFWIPQIFLHFCAPRPLYSLYIMRVHARTHEEIPHFATSTLQNLEKHEKNAKKWIIILSVQKIAVLLQPVSRSTNRECQKTVFERLNQLWCSTRIGKNKVPCQCTLSNKDDCSELRFKFFTTKSLILAQDER